MEQNKENNFQNDDINERSQIQTTLKLKKLKDSGLIKNNQKSLVQQLKLNHGLYLNGCSLENSKQAVLIESGELNINLFDDQPSAYLSSFNSNENDGKLNESLRPTEICFNFPVAEITYNAGLSESFLNFTNDDEEKLFEMYGHLLPRKILIGGKLFIDGLESINSTQIDIFNSYLTWVYNFAKYKKEIPFNDLSAAQNHFPKITTTEGINLDTHEKLTDWMNNLYRDDKVEIISYNNLIPISQLKSDTISCNNLVLISKFDTTSSLIDEKQPGVANFKEKLTLENWAKYLKYTKLVKEFQLFQGLIIDQNFELKICEENAFELINFPNIDSNDKFYLEIIKPTLILEDIFIDNNIFLTDNNEDISSFPFFKVSADDLSYEDKAYFIVKCERYKISLNRNNIKPSEKFKQAIKEALESMKPLIYLQEIFDEYGHFISLSIILGKSLKNTIENSSYISKRIDLASLAFESLKSHLADFGITYLLTQKEDIIEENGLSEWIQNTKNDLEIIEYDNIIPLYDILEIEQKKKIDLILNKQNNFRIIMTGSVNLKDSHSITEKIIINIEPSLDNNNYEVFGSIVSKNNSKLEDTFVTFGSYEINKFSATTNISKNINISKEECQSITLQRNNSSYSIKTSHKLSQGYDISLNCFKPMNIEFTGWSRNCVYLNISNTNIDFNYVQPNVEVAVCTLHSDLGNSIIDINGKGYTMGYNLTENNYIEEPQLEQANIRKYINKRYPTKIDKEKENRLIIDNKNLEFHLDLSEFVNLEEFICSRNQFTSLDISKNKQLIEIDCSQNKLVSLDLSNCLNIKSITANSNQLNELKLPVTNNEKLEYLNLLDNSFSQNLNCFSSLVNLKELLIGNIDGDRIQQGIYNQFHGSLRPLKELVKLESLSISNTDIESGIEFLPDSITNFRCLADKRSEAKVKKIYEQLEIYTISHIDGRYNLKAWKNNWKLVKKNEDLYYKNKQFEKLNLKIKFIELEKEGSSLHAKKEEVINKYNQLERKVKNLEEEKDILKQENNDLKKFVNELNTKLKQKEKDYEVYYQTMQQINEEDKLKSLIAEELVEKKRLQKEIKDLKHKLAIKEEDIKQSEKQLEETNRKLELEDEKYVNIKNELDNIKSSLSGIEEKKVELNKLEKKLEHEKRFTKNGTSGLRRQMNDLKKQIHLLHEQAAKAKEMENKLEETRKHKEDLQNEQINQQACIKKLYEDKGNLQQLLEILNNKLKEKEKFICNLQQQSAKKITALYDGMKENEKLINKPGKQNEEKTNNEIKDEVIFIDKLNDRNSQKKITALNKQSENSDIINKHQQQTDELKRQLNEETREYQEDLTPLNYQLRNNEELSVGLKSELNEVIEKYQYSQNFHSKEIFILISQIQADQKLIDLMLKKRKLV
ncbi:hypothetical protein GLOIN_2v1798919 [Rhizophagus irregularis DAOM 181602=DAOM 197198]|nr:hypothetical protein GLOIN_2v1798919 [Rhizophagus irregularis DAOM 181602=DAOM 197198]